MEDKKEPGEEVGSVISSAQAALGEGVQQATGQALSRASGMANNVLAAGRHAAQTASHQVNEQPLLAVIVGFILGYIRAFITPPAPVTSDTVDDSRRRAPR